MDYSIVVPFHDEEGNLPELYRRLTRVMESLNVEYEHPFDEAESDRGELKFVISYFTSRDEDFSLNINVGQALQSRDWNARAPPQVLHRCEAVVAPSGNEQGAVPVRETTRGAEPEPDDAQGLDPVSQRPQAPPRSGLEQ